MLSLGGDAALSLFRDRVPEFHCSITMSIALQAVSAWDASSLRAFGISVLGDSPYPEPMLAALDAALGRESDEYRGIVASDDGALAGLIVFGAMPGALGTGRIHLVAVRPETRRRGIARDLIDAACAWLGERGGRLTMIELAADPWFEAAQQLARRTGFREEGRIDGYVRDGAALLLLRRDLQVLPRGAS